MLKAPWRRIGTFSRRSASSAALSDVDGEQRVEPAPHAASVANIHATPRHDERTGVLDSLASSFSSAGNAFSLHSPGVHVINDYYAARHSSADGAVSKAALALSSSVPSQPAAPVAAVDGQQHHYAVPSRALLFESSLLTVDQRNQVCFRVVFCSHLLTLSTFFFSVYNDNSWTLHDIITLNYYFVGKHWRNVLNY